MSADEGAAPWPEDVDGAELLRELAETFTRHIWLPEHADTVLALWTLHTYGFETFMITPRLVITSPEKGCGKTTALGVLKLLCHKPRLSANMSPAVLFRVIGTERPTVLIDEADSFIKGKDELRGIINSGHNRDGAVARCEGDNFEPKYFSTWAPLALAGIGRMPGTIEDRALIVTLQRKSAGEAAKQLRARDDYPDLRRKARRWADDNRDKLKGIVIQLPPFLQNRAADNWEPLFAIAQFVGGDWPQRVESAARALANAYDDPSEGIDLLARVRELFKTSEKDRVTTEEIARHLTGDDESPWYDYNGSFRPVTKNQISRFLGTFGIRSKNLNLGDKRRPKGFERKQFDDAFARYLPPD